MEQNTDDTDGEEQRNELVSHFEGAEPVPGSIEDLAGRPRIRTKYNPREFIEAYEDAETLSQEGDVRRVLQSLDDGRFHEMLDATHRVVAHSDKKRREWFCDQYSQHLKEWLVAFATVEELNTFPEYIEVNDE